MSAKARSEISQEICYVDTVVSGNFAKTVNNTLVLKGK